MKVFAALIFAWQFAATPMLFGQIKIGERPNRPVETTRHQLIVTPAPQPEPLLKYSLYPRSYELKPGNAATMWFHAMYHLVDDEEKAEQNRNVELGLMEVEDEVDQRFLAYQEIFRSAHIAAYRREMDWDLDIAELRGSDVLTFRLREFQEMRTLARLLSSKTQMLISEGRFDEAIEEMKVSFRLAHDVAEPETLINDLLGLAFQNIALVDVENLITTPNSPNLYWALMQMPEPLIDIRSGMEMEMTFYERWRPWLGDPESIDWSPEEWHDEMIATIQDSKDNFGSLLPGIDESSTEQQIEEAYQLFSQRVYPKAARLLVENGRPFAEVKEMPVDKVLALREHWLYQKYSQKLAAFTLLPYRDSLNRYDAFKESSKNDLEDSLMQELLINFQTAYASQQRRVAFHRVYLAIEAIRMHLVETDGQLPDSLDEITIVPIPEFPFTGEPFEYWIEGETAVIDVPVPNWPQRFEITVAADK